MKAIAYRSCDDCGGEGGWETVAMPLSKWSDPTPGGSWIDCPTCGGCGLTEGEPEALTQYDLLERCGDEA